MMTITVKLSFLSFKFPISGNGPPILKMFIVHNLHTIQWSSFASREEVGEKVEMKMRRLPGYLLAPESGVTSVRDIESKHSVTRH